MVKLLTLILLSALTFVPTPVIQPGNPFVFDSAQCLSPAMLAVYIPVGVIYSGQLDVYEPDGEDVTVTADKISVSGVPVTVADPNDPLGMAVIHTFDWSWTPVANDVGIHYVNVEVADPYDAKDARTLVMLIRVNSPPVITGCR